MLLNPPIRQRKAGFSLVEVVIAIGVVSFAMLAILGSLPVGIQSMQDSMQQQAKATITQQLRADLQQLPFEKSADADKAEFNIEALETVTWYYTTHGMKTDEKQAFFAATFRLQPASLESEGGTAGVEYTSATARNVQVTLEYPMSAPPQNRKQLRLTLFSARQKNV